MLSPERQADHVERSQSTCWGLREWFDDTCDLLFPPVCCLCGRRDLSDDRGLKRLSLCATCVDELVGQARRACSRCARPLPEELAAGSNGCPSCRDRSLSFDRAYVLGVYDGLLRSAVLKMKQATGEMLTMAMGRLLADHISGELSEPPGIVLAVPTHWSRRLTRTTNCPELLMEVVSRRLRVPASPGRLRCRRKTKKQGTLLPTERLKNVRRAYGVSAGYAIRGARIRDAAVLVVDDVMTTGATANEVAKVLQAAGAKQVTVAAVARGIGFDS